MELQEARKHLFDPTTRLFSVLDGVMVPDLPNKLREASVPHYCVLPGELPPDMIYAAPYLVYLSPDSKLADWIISESFGKSWGIFFQSRRSMLEMRRHFRALHQVYDERGNPLKFRYYDPRVLTSFLPTCNGGELKTLFGDVDKFFVESTDGKSLVIHRLLNGKLETSTIEPEVK